MTAIVMIRLAIVGLLGALVFGAQAQTAPQSRFGVVEGFWFPELTCSLGVGWERIIFDWAQHQPSAPDDWHTLNVDDRWLKAASLCNREVVALLKHTPSWATDGTAGVGLPRGLSLSLDDPDNVWANFVRRAAAYYASRGVQHFIVWNEPDITSDTYGYEFEGDLEDYYQLLKVAYLAAKQGNPSAKLVVAGTTYWHDVNEGRAPFIERLLERIATDPTASDNDYYFDAIALHIYFRTETVYDITYRLRQKLAEYGLSHKELWINETNAGPTDDPLWPVIRPVYQIDLQQQADFLVQAAALGLAAGAQRIAVYKLYDQALPSGGESFGILSPLDAAPRPAYDAWRTVVTQFSDVVDAQHYRGQTLEAVRLAHRDGRESLVLWARADQPARALVRGEMDKAYLSNASGAMTIVRPREEGWTIELAGARCNPTDGCAVGGPVQIITLALAGASVAEWRDGAWYDVQWNSNR